MFSICQQIIITELFIDQIRKMQKKPSLDQCHNYISEVRFSIIPLEIQTQVPLKQETVYKIYFQKGKQVLGEINKPICSGTVSNKILKVSPIINQFNFQVFHQRNMDFGISIYEVCEGLQYYSETINFDLKDNWTNYISSGQHFQKLTKLFPLAKLKITFCVIVGPDQNSITSTLEKNVSLAQYAQETRTLTLTPNPDQQPTNSNIKQMQLSQIQSPQTQSHETPLQNAKNLERASAQKNQSQNIQKTQQIAIQSQQEKQEKKLPEEQVQEEKVKVETGKEVSAEQEQQMFLKSLEQLNKQAEKERQAKISQLQDIVIIDDVVKVQQGFDKVQVDEKVSSGSPAKQIKQQEAVQTILEELKTKTQSPRRNTAKNSAKNIKVQQPGNSEVQSDQTNKPTKKYKIFALILILLTIFGGLYLSQKYSVQKKEVKTKVKPKKTKK